MRFIHRSFATGCALAFASAIAAQSVPTAMNYQGRLTDNGAPPAPLTATVAMQFAIFDAATSGNSLWQEPAGATTVPVAVTGGIFSVILGGNGVPLPASLFTPGADRWLEVRAGGEALAPRQKLSANGWAMQSQGSFDSAALGGVAASGWQARVAGTCAAGNAISSIAANGTVGCQSAGSSYSAGNGLQLAGTVFSADFAGSGVATTVARSDHAHAADSVLLVAKEGPGHGLVTTSAAELASCDVTQSACAAAFRPSATSVTLSATPDANSSFAGWSGDCSGTGGCSVTLAANRRVTAHFSPLTYNVSVDTTPNSYRSFVDGAVYSVPAGLYCGLQCSAPFPAGSAVSLYAPASPGGFRFHGWTGACSGTGACALTLNAPAAVGATWDYQFALYVGQFAGVASAGTVTAAAQGISCNSANSPCINYFPLNTVFTLTAAPVSGAKFLGWTSAFGRPTTSNLPCNNSTSSSCTVGIYEPLVLYASFGYTITVTNGNKPGGTISSSYDPYGNIFCGGFCASNFQSNTVITLTAAPVAGHSFLGWGGACSGISLTCNVTTDADKTVTANFS